MPKLSLRLTILALSLMGTQAVAAFAQEAMPVTPVTGEVLPAPDKNAPVVVELFSSQACIFCPRADRLFADLVKQPNVIGLACHVDYFDVKTGSLSHRFCSDRQSWYQNVMRNGPNYTPQMVMQGHIDVVGYKIDDISEGIKQAAQTPVKQLYVFATDKKDEFRVALPEGTSVQGGNLFVLIYDRPHNITIAEGRNKGQNMTYVNIVSDMRDLGVWPETQQGTVVAAPLTDGQQGFALLLQNAQTGKIIAAGKFKKELPPNEPQPN